MAMNTQTRVRVMDAAVRKLADVVELLAWVKQPSAKAVRAAAKVVRAERDAVLVSVGGRKARKKA